jgi:hypothetical protein
MMLVRQMDIEQQLGHGARVARLFLTQYTKTKENIPDYHSITKWQ